MSVDLIRSAFCAACLCAGSHAVLAAPGAPIPDAVTGTVQPTATRMIDWSEHSIRTGLPLLDDGVAPATASVVPADRARRSGDLGSASSVVQALLSASNAHDAVEFQLEDAKSVAGHLESSVSGHASAASPSYAGSSRADSSRADSFRALASAALPVNNPNAGSAIGVNALTPGMGLARSADAAVADGSRGQSQLFSDENALADEPGIFAGLGAVAWIALGVLCLGVGGMIGLRYWLVRRDQTALRRWHRRHGQRSRGSADLAYPRP